MQIKFLFSENKIFQVVTHILKNSEDNIHLNTLLSILTFSDFKAFREESSLTRESYYDVDNHGCIYPETVKNLLNENNSEYIHVDEYGNVTLLKDAGDGELCEAETDILSYYLEKSQNLVE